MPSLWKNPAVRALHSGAKGTKVIKIVIDDEEERALSPEAKEMLRRRAAEVGFSTLDWIVQLLELHAEQDEEDEPEDEE